MLRKIALVAGLVVMGLSSQARAALLFLGPGACRSASGAAGSFDVHKNVSWPQCTLHCVTLPTCRAVEYTMFANGTTNCEVHKKSISSVTSSDFTAGHLNTCWLNN
jgi:hypothetical protein